MKKLLLLLSLIPTLLFGQQNLGQVTTVGNTTTKIMKYNANHGAQFDARTVVDKGYVDSVKTTIPAWLLTGNSGTTAGTNFLGTTDATDLVFKRNSVELGRFNNTNGLSLTSTGTTTATFSQVNKNVSGVDLFDVYSSGQILAGNDNDDNLFMGYLSGLNYSGGANGENAAFGHHTLMSNTSGKFNVALGGDAMELNTSGVSNVAVGKDALDVNISGGGNVAIGYQALISNTIADNNVAIGSGALSNNTTHTGLVAVGYEALQLCDNDNNTAVGYNALSNCTGTENTAVGRSAGLNTLGGNGGNCFYGHFSGATNTTGYQNSYFGDGAGFGTTNYGNSIFGFNAGNSETGNEAVIMGYYAGYTATGSNILYLGSRAGRYMTSASNWLIFNVGGDQGSKANDTSLSLITGYDGGNLATRRINLNGHVRIQDGTQAAGDILTSDANGYSTWSTPGSLLHVISTPTVGATVSLTNKYINIISPAGTLASLTINFPNSPSNNDFVEVTFDQIVTTVTYAAGTGGATIKGQINGVVGGQKRWDYDSGTNTWY